MFKWIAENWSYLLSAFFGVIVVASIIVKLTPETKDNSILKKIIDLLDNLSVAKTDSDKKLIEMAKENLKEQENEE